MSERDFRGVWIPAEIWLSTDLSALEKCLLAEIDSLDSGPKHCFKSNESFSEFLGCSVPTITRGIKKLVSMGFISVTSKKTSMGSIRVITSLIKMMRPPNQNDETPPNQNDEHSISLPLEDIRNTEKNASSMPKVIDPLYHPIEQSFLSQGRFTNYQKEGALIKDIIKGIRNLDPDDPEGAARRILETFRTLTAGNERFWREQPFTPSGLSPNLARVWAIVQKSEPRQEDWFENLQGGGSVSEPIPFR